MKKLATIVNPYIHRFFSKEFTKISETKRQCLPKLVFGESHWDLATPKIFSKLLLELKNLGYQDFFEESWEGCTIQEHLERINQEISHYQKLKQNLAKINLDITTIKFEDFTHYVDTLVKLTPSSHDFNANIEITIKYFWEIIRRYPHHKEHEKFLTLLQNNNINYHGIDLKRPEDFNPSQAKTYSIHMANNYLKAKMPVFGRVGLAHIETIQNQIKQSHSNNEHQFCFFYLYSKPPLLHQDNLEEKLRNGKMRSRYPYKLYPIDTESNSEENVINKILDVVGEALAENIDRTRQVKPFGF